jgi:hypothetical protein
MHGSRLQSQEPRPPILPTPAVLGMAAVNVLLPPFGMPTLTSPFVIVGRFMLLAKGDFTGLPPSRRPTRLPAAELPALGAVSTTAPLTARAAQGYRLIVVDVPVELLLQAVWADKAPGPR